MSIQRRQPRNLQGVHHPRLITQLVRALVLHRTNRRKTLAKSGLKPYPTRMKSSTIFAVRKEIQNQELRGVAQVSPRADRKVYPGRIRRHLPLYKTKEHHPHPQLRDPLATRHTNLLRKRDFLRQESQLFPTTVISEVTGAISHLIFSST